MKEPFCPFYLEIITISPLLLLINPPSQSCCDIESKDYDKYKLTLKGEGGRDGDEKKGMGRVGFEPTTPAMSRRYLNQARPPALIQWKICCPNICCRSSLTWKLSLYLRSIRRAYLASTGNKYWRRTTSQSQTTRKWCSAADTRARADSVQLKTNALRQIEYINSIEERVRERSV